MAFLQHRNIFFARYMKGKLYLNLKCKIDSWFDSLQVFFTETSRLKSLLTSTSQESAHNLSERTSSVDLPVWKSLHVSLITWLHFPMPTDREKNDCQRNSVNQIYSIIGGQQKSRINIRKYLHHPMLPNFVWPKCPPITDRQMIELFNK